MRSSYVDSNEKQQAVLGNTYFQEFCSSGSVGKGFCEVTDKRAYIKGKCFYKNGNSYKSNSEDRIVELKDIIGTGFVTVKYMWLMIVAILAFVASLFVMVSLAGTEVDTESTILFVTPIAIFVISLLLYLILKKRLFEISFAGGKIGFIASDYSESEIQQFESNLGLAKDRMNSSVSVAQAEKGSTAEELKKYKELLDSGVISADEFEQTKKRLLGL